MTKRVAAVLFISLVAACVGAPPEHSGTGGGTGGGNGDGTGGGNGSGSGSGSGSGGGTSGSMTATSFLASMAQKFCDEAFLCKANFPTTSGTTFDQAFGASSAACVSDSAAYDMPSVVESEITAGKIKFSATDAAACVAGITFPACTTYWTAGPMAPPACSTALVGTIADGAACLVDYDCSNVQSYCDSTTKKCTVDTGTGARMQPRPGNPDYGTMQY